ncbi:MAG: RNA polymerase sigma factor RpoH [Burkholderiales bacterium]|nr:RNA polymerase sigma factor RpoH [Burkholderiales bacterium]
MTTALALKATNPWAMPVPSVVGSIEAYISAVNRFPVLSADEESRYARDYREREDLQAAGKLVLSHLRLVVSVARGYLGYGLPHADLIQEGNIGLMKAVKRFDPERGVRLVSFAMHWIKAEIHEYVLRNWRLVKIATTKAQRKLFFNLRSHKQGSAAFTGEEVDALAAELNVKADEVREMETRFAGGDMALEGPADRDDESFAPIAYLADPAAEPSVILERDQLEVRRGAALKDALAELDERSRRIVESRWLREGENQLTLHDLAAEFGVSAERIRQIEVKALKKMKQAMAGLA